MLPFSVRGPHNAEPETKIWMQAASLVILPGSRSEEAESKLENKEKHSKG